ncbi:MAG: cytochrome c [Gammaproteobacteria bacterium]|nr:cytochrome c [Gammaproteobacteria bacterium]
MSLNFQHLGINVIVSVVITILTVGVQPASAQSNRGYDEVNLTQGKELYAQHCAVCHGKNGESTVKDWHQRDTNGRFPPPPLNGTAHTWHHSFGALMHTIQNGTQENGGGMPAWKETLSNEEIFSIIMWITSLWPDEIFAAWMQRN